MESKFKVTECVVFFSFFRIRLRLSNPDLVAGEAILSAQLIPLASDDRLDQRLAFDPNHVIVEALIDRAAFPEGYDLEILTNRGRHRVGCSELVEVERQEHARSSMGEFLAILDGWKARNPGRKPKVLDIGGRARSGYLLSEHLLGCDVTVLDIRADAGVDVVADIHSMSNALEHESFDFLISVSVFEHLVMPWKAAIEINKVLKPGGLAMIVTHQTVGMHDLPWDYYRFSDESWKGLFNVATGFEIVTTAMNDFVRVVPNHYFNVGEGYENAGGFYTSSVIARKSGSTQLAWPVETTSIVSTMYPE
ncbi:MAG: hypothetical protein C3F11_05725 [Methylocystaceae bacterium]|nr:MAG: hypothetical protein C3F11_05725 [Methylocystaceae bacterium]